MRLVVVSRWNIARGILSKEDDCEQEQDGNTLFSNSNGVGTKLLATLFASFNIPVDISGSKASLLPVIHSFKELERKFNECLAEQLRKNISKCKYLSPLPVQKYAFPVILVGRDVMCYAQGGSGKSLAFLLPIIGRMAKLGVPKVGDLTEPFSGA